VHDDADLYERGAATLLASWTEYARGAVDASLQRSFGVAVAVFPHEPERGVYNNALLDSSFLAAAEPTAYHVLLARLRGETVATAMAFDLDGDSGIYNVGTLVHARRQGLGTALTAIQLHDAHARGCETASLQATRIAECLYTSTGFRDLGRILEYAPPPARARAR
jgi:ribosomal protein S18 acetylase RimI-like enzyme